MVLIIEVCQFLLVGFYLPRENSVSGDRKEGTSASVAMVHSIPELIVSEQVCVGFFLFIYLMMLGILWQ